MIHRLLVLLVLVLWSGVTWGQFLSPVVLNPNPAHTSEDVFVGFITGPCVGVLGGENNPSVTVIGDSVDVLINGIWETNPQLCFGPPSLDRSIPIGSFFPGDYQVTIRFRYERLFMPPAIEVLGTLDLEVQGDLSDPYPVHGLSLISKSILIVLICALGAWVCVDSRF